MGRGEATRRKMASMNRGYKSPSCFVRTHPVTGSGVQETQDGCRRVRKPGHASQGVGSCLEPVACMGILSPAWKVGCCPQDR